MAGHRRNRVGTCFTLGPQGKMKCGPNQLWSTQSGKESFFWDWSSQVNSPVKHFPPKPLDLLTSHELGSDVSLKVSLPHSSPCLHQDVWFLSLPLEFGLCFIACSVDHGAEVLACQFWDPNLGKPHLSLPVSWCDHSRHAATVLRGGSSCSREKN